MMRLILICLFLCQGFVKLAAQKFRENICVGLTNGIVIPGPLSHGGSFFTGYKTEMLVGYVWPSSKSNWGIETNIGIARIIYITKFEKNISLRHRQTLGTVHLLGFVKISPRLKMMTGLTCFFPSNYMVMVSGKSNNTQYSYGNTDLNSGYNTTKLQAGAVVGLQYLLGKKQKWNIALLVSQMGNGPVKTERDFSAEGIPVTISKDLKPIHFDFKIAFHLSYKKKDSSNSD